MIRIFNTKLDDGSFGRRAFNIEHIIAGRPKTDNTIIITTLVGEFEVQGKLEDLVDSDPLQVFSGAATGV